MKLFLSICLWFVIFGALAASRDRNNKPYRVVCYWGTWAFYRPGPGKFQAENVNPNICTHVNYGFAKLTGNKIALFDPDLDDGDEDWHSGLPWGHGMIARMNNLRNYNPHLTTMISIGGWNEGSDKYSMMVRNPRSRKEFVQSVLDFLHKYDLDGLDLDWEYPAMAASGDADRKPGRDQDRDDYSALLSELKEAFKPHGYLLTAAVSAGKPTIDRAYDIPALSRHLDFVNLMSYDFHGGWENHTAHNAPLYAHAEDIELDKEFTVSYAVDYWLKKGMDPKKLVLGIPLYGRTFTLAGSAHGIGAPAQGHGGRAGSITRTIGMLGYNEICNMIQSGWDIYRDKIQKIPYAVHANQWIGYDDKISVEEKLKFLMDHGLGGAMVWSVDTDDFAGYCNMGKYPLLKAISKKLNNVDGPDPVIPRPHFSTTTQKPDHPTTKKHNDDTTPTGPHTPTPRPTTSDPSKKFVCHSAGFFKDPANRRKFHQCVDMGGYLKDFVFECGEGTHYDENLHVCVRD